MLLVTRGREELLSFGELRPRDSQSQGYDTLFGNLWLLASPCFWAPRCSLRQSAGANSGSCVWYTWSSCSLTWSRYLCWLPKLPSLLQQLAFLVWLNHTLIHTHNPHYSAPGRCGIWADSNSQAQPAGPSGKHEPSGNEQYWGRRCPRPQRFPVSKATALGSCDILKADEKEKIIMPKRFSLTCPSHYIINVY